MVIQITVSRAAPRHRGGSGRESVLKAGHHEVATDLGAETERELAAMRDARRRTR
jgi:hypothetical protein